MEIFHKLIIILCCSSRPEQLAVSVPYSEQTAMRPVYMDALISSDFIIPSDNFRPTVYTGYDLIRCGVHTRPGI